ncbi:MAG TPA: hypothetical protein DGD08_18025 [Gemmatimonas aurantiaca]|uniref:Uncharacterized protein n=1 Tax=Gemmatimonas aurantiaca TaxID=173480 RepID=A0A3D4VDA8_9BACT|nr:hypothetical protein [Gemmatimonas aurantiaca]
MARFLLRTLGTFGQLRLWSVGALLWVGGVGATVFAPTAARADSRAFTVCFTGGGRSCTYLELTTTAFFDGAGGRIGTAVDLFVRHAEGQPANNAAVVSALTGFHFAYAGSAVTPAGTTDISDELGLTSALVLTDDPSVAPYPVYTDGWRHTARSSTATSASPEFDNYLAFTNALQVDNGSGQLLTQYVGGCGVAAANGGVDAFYQTEMWTCGNGGYQFLTFTDAWFDAANVHSVGVSTWARFADSDVGVAAFCTRYLDTNTSFGDADGTPRWVTCAVTEV